MAGVLPAIQNRNGQQGGCSVTHPGDGWRRQLSGASKFVANRTSAIGMEQEGDRGPLP